MASSSALFLKWASALLLCMVMAAYVVEGAMTCGTVATSVMSCIPYATGRVSTPSVGCCNGIKSLNNAAKTTSDRQTACNCLKTITGGIPGINFNTVESLPKKCHVSIPYKIIPSTDCKKVK